MFVGLFVAPCLGCVFVGVGDEIMGHVENGKMGKEVVSALRLEEVRVDGVCGLVDVSEREVHLHAIPLLASLVAAGFPSPAEDSCLDRLTLESLVVEHPESTFFVRVTGDSMTEAGIFDGDILVVDRAGHVREGAIVIAAVDGDFTVKYYHVRDGVPVLEPAHGAFSPIVVGEGSEFLIWGVVRYAIHRV